MDKWRDRGGESPSPLVLGRQHYPCVCERSRQTGRSCGFNPKLSVTGRAMDFLAFLPFVAFPDFTLNLALSLYHQICQVNNQKFFFISITCKSKLFYYIAFTPTKTW